MREHSPKKNKTKQNPNNEKSTHFEKWDENNPKVFKLTSTGVQNSKVVSNMATFRKNS